MKYLVTLLVLVITIAQALVVVPQGSGAAVRETYTPVPTIDPRDALDATVLARRINADATAAAITSTAVEPTEWVIYVPYVEKPEPTPPPTATPEPVQVVLVNDVQMPGAGTLYGAVQPSMVQDRTGVWWIALYILPPKGSSVPAGTRIATWTIGDPAFKFITGVIGDGPRGMLGVGCDQQLYLFTYDDVNRRILAIYRITGFPGPAQPTACATTSVRVTRGEPLK